MAHYSEGDSGSTTEHVSAKPVPPSQKSPTLLQLITTASIVLVDGQRMESYEVNVYTGYIRLTTRNSCDGKLTFHSKIGVLLNDDGSVTLDNVRVVPHKFEFYHAVPFNQNPTQE